MQTDINVIVEVIGVMVDGGQKGPSRKNHVQGLLSP